MKLLKVYDEYVQVYKYRIQNATICCTFGPVQLVISAASLGQHVFSLSRYQSVFACNFDRLERYLGSDIVIYDFGLFYKLWNIKECIANYLDGGYMRFVWCINHVLGIMFMLLIVGFIQKPRAILLCPIIAMQSFYSIGLLVLTLSALPKMLPLFFAAIRADLVMPLAIYICGVTMNCFLTYILWHYYWFLGSLRKTKKPPKQYRNKERVIEALPEIYPTIRPRKYTLTPPFAPLLTIIDAQGYDGTTTVV